MPLSVNRALYPTPESEDPDTGFSPDGVTQSFNKANNAIDTANNATDTAEVTANAADTSVLQEAAVAQSMGTTEPTHGEWGTTIAKPVVWQKNYRGSLASKIDKCQPAKPRGILLVLGKELMWGGRRL